MKNEFQNGLWFHIFRYGANRVQEEHIFERQEKFIHVSNLKEFLEKVVGECLKKDDRRDKT
jgi:hypothetical protein